MINEECLKIKEQNSKWFFWNLFVAIFVLFYVSDLMVQNLRNWFVNNSNNIEVDISLIF